MAPTTINMAHQSLIVIDNFYDNPDEIKNLALSLDFTTKSGGTYPGVEAIASEMDWTSSWKKLRGYIEEDVDAPCPLKDGFPQGKFYTALLIAVEQSSIKIVELLLSLGADLTLTRQDGQSVFDLVTDESVFELLDNANVLDEFEDGFVQTHISEQKNKMADEKIKDASVSLHGMFRSNNV